MNTHRPLNAAIPVPKHHQVYLLLLEKLKNGAFANGFPNEFSLMAQYQVARVTIRKAMARLADEGLIERSPRRGTRPTANSASLADIKLAGLLGSLFQANLKLAIRVLYCEQIPASNVVRAALGLPEGSDVMKSVRLRSASSGPVSHVTSFTPLEFSKAIKADKPEPLLVLLKEAGVEVGRAKQRISAQLADALVAPLLDVEVGSALLAVSRIFFNKQDRPVQFEFGLYRPDRYQYEMELSEHGDLDAKVWISQAST
ncbi:GntR family transcriptional regulator [Parapusillimonas granuli]|uniref:GntR family transcriptional regulator n=1 Tax=Parapusillimonas granuli TaxID=380911 RepID=A0A853FUY4_9BURK|nr:GntR family transcriptional regulator [Parapusillimonas granuli]MBB5215558.1 GntR family transcriptional regulator [Parapusillimonas granuli]MEB2401087.1 GntR family transcriptional regulator [Alcaligenaceae bacterium]NYT49775.1 GntR family transcriptional regulator [Parapusillimonas granuli]